ncbi:DUF1768-domain-containing protein, partial [Exidia glandulosa HHB12029]
FDGANPNHPFSLISPHKIMHKKKLYRTASHLYHAYMFMKTRSELVEQMRDLEDPRATKYLALRHDSTKRSDWEQVWLEKMDETMYAKFTQHADLREELLRTGDVLLVNSDSSDGVWGVGNNGLGMNHLGKSLMRVRDRIVR